MRKIIRGGADGSYGIEVAHLAGVKKDVTKRAKEILAEVEDREGVKSATTKASLAPVEKNVDFQMSFMGMSNSESEIIDEIKNMNLDSITPMEALTKLYALKAKAQNG